MEVTILWEARAELADALKYYHDESPDLSRRFYEQFQAAVTKLPYFPHARPGSFKNTRKCRIKGFPYALIYHVRGQTLTVVAVMHLSRRPGYWRGRLS